MPQKRGFVSVSYVALEPSCGVGPHGRGECKVVWCSLNVQFSAPFSWRVLSVLCVCSFSTSPLPAPNSSTTCTRTFPSSKATASSSLARVSTAAPAIDPAQHHTAFPCFTALEHASKDLCSFLAHARRLSDKLCACMFRVADLDMPDNSSAGDVSFPFSFHLHFHSHIKLIFFLKAEGQARGRGANNGKVNRVQQGWRGWQGSQGSNSVFSIHYGLEVQVHQRHAHVSKKSRVNLSSSQYLCDLPSLFRSVAHTHKLMLTLLGTVVLLLLLHCPDRTLFGWGLVTGREGRNKLMSITQTYNGPTRRECIQTIGRASSQTNFPPFTEIFFVCRSFGEYVLSWWSSVYMHDVRPWPKP